VPDIPLFYFFSTSSHIVMYSIRMEINCRPFPAIIGHLTTVGIQYSSTEGIYRFQECLQFSQEGG